MPEAVAAAVVSFFSLTGTTAAVVSAGVQLAVIAAANAVIKQDGGQKQQGGLIDLQLNSAAPRQLVIGKRMVGGVLVDWYLAGTNNTKLYMPTYLAEGPCGQVTRVFAGGREVWSTALVHGVRTTIPDFRSGGDRLWLTYYDGRVGQTADATLVALAQGWTSVNKMTGCAWVLVECQWDPDNMRSPPQLSFEMEGAKLYDRRKDTTAGGSGSHRIDDPATWEWSDNPAVALDHYMLGRYIGSVRTFGIGLSSDEAPYDRFAAQAAICDEDVDLKAGGTQKRYRANGFMFANEDYSSVIAKLCTAMAARPADFGGRFGVIGAESRTPVMTIDDADMVAGVAEVYTPKRSWAELVGAIEGRFQDPAQLYQPVDYPRITDATWEAEDGGEPKVLTLDLDFETHVERAQRLATLRARAERRQATLRGVYPLWAVELERGDWFVRTGDKWGVDGKTFEVIERALDAASWTVTIVSQEVDPADSAWDETTAQDGPATPDASTDELSAVTAPSLTVTSNPIVGAASSTPAIKLVFTNPTDPRVNHMFVEVYRTSDGLKVATETVGIPDADGVVIIQNGIADAVAHTVRARYLTPGLSSAWSTSYAVTTGAGYSVGAAVSVPWSGVTNDGARPADNATVGARSGTNLYRTDGTTVLTQAEVRTAEGVAASIAGQADLATTAKAALPFGANGIANSEMVGSASPPVGWTAASAGSSGFTPVGTLVARDHNAMKAAITGTPTAGTVFHTGSSRGRSEITLARRYALPCAAGDKIGASALVACLNATRVDLVIGWLDATGAYLTETTITGAGAGIDGDAVNAVGYASVSGVATAPANTVYATLNARVICSGAANPIGWAMTPMLARLPAGQTAVPAYAPSPPDRGADTTLENTAAAITSQGALATASQVNLGASGRVYRDDGSTRLTDALAVTSLGTASGITSQGTQATANAQRGTSYSGTPVEGSWWADTSTTPNKVKFYTGGAWQEVATLVADAVASGFMTATMTTDYSTTHGSTTSMSVSPQVSSIANGSGSYTYQWAVVDMQDGVAPTLTNAQTSQVTATSGSIAGASDYVGTLSCTITDSNGKQCVKYFNFSDTSTI